MRKEGKNEVAKYERGRHAGPNKERKACKEKKACSNKERKVCFSLIPMVFQQREQTSRKTYFSLTLWPHR